MKGDGNLNYSAEKLVTHAADSAQDAREKGGWLDEKAAMAQLVRMILAVRGKGEVLQPITVESVKRLKELIGIGSMTTREGIRYWVVREGFKLRLEAAGIDVETGVIVDEGKFEVAIRGLKQEEAKRLEAKYEGRDREWRRESIRKSLERWRAPAVKKAVNAEGIMREQAYNVMIAKEIRKMGGEGK